MKERQTDTLLRRIPGISRGGDADLLMRREWLVTNGLGGYASGTVAGVATRRYHGLLIAALPNPIGRLMTLSHLDELVTLPDGTEVRLDGHEWVGGRLDAPGAHHLAEFCLEAGLPVWRYEMGGVSIEKRVVLPHRQNTVVVSYQLTEGAGPVRLKLRPAVHFRGHDAPVNTALHERHALTVIDQYYGLAVDGGLPPLHLRLQGQRSTFQIGGERLTNLLYRVEEARGYAFKGSLWIAGHFTLELGPNQPGSLVASIEPRDVMDALLPEEVQRLELDRRRRLLISAVPAAQEGIGAELVLAADQFIITPVGRLAEVTRAHAAGDEVRTVIAGYHWFTDWGRDTMVSLEGLTLATGRGREAGYILRTFAQYIRDGLIPNLFPEGQKEGLYHTADATLWFFHAIDRYVQLTGDRWTLRLLLSKLVHIVEHHLRGTRFGIGVDPADGLLREGAEGYQLTWMDAKVEDWVVTPRRGKAVEINALWYNALCLLESWVREERSERESAPLAEHAARARESFNRRFWYAEGGYLYDVIDGEGGDDSACRPNQLFAISLEHPVLERVHWEPVLDVVQQRLLTPVGLRSLAPGSPDYKPRYDGDLRARDAAYHQGTVWAWLIGPWVDAWLKVHPDDRAGARRAVQSLGAQLSAFGIGSIAEIFDAEAPYTPRGCIAQAWSVAEALRCWVKTG